MTQRAASPKPTPAGGQLTKVGAQHAIYRQFNKLEGVLCGSRRWSEPASGSSPASPRQVSLSERVSPTSLYSLYKLGEGGPSAYSQFQGLPGAVRLFISLA